MNAFIVYDSRFGNTAQVAQAIAEALKAFGPVSVQPVMDIPTLQLPPEADVIIFGCPTQRRRLTPAFAALLDRIEPVALHRKPVAVFDTRYPMWALLSGSAAQRIAHQLRGLGAEIIVPPESFFVEGRSGPLAAGELARAAGFAKRLQAALAARPR